MNIDKIKAVIEAIKVSDTFDMSCFYSYEGKNTNGQCGSPACIAGHAEHMFIKRGSDEYFFNSTHDNAQNILGLSEEQAYLLFDPEAYIRDDNYEKIVHNDSITKDQAIATLERLIETGEVDWKLP